VADKKDPVDPSRPKDEADLRQVTNDLVDELDNMLKETDEQLAQAQGKAGQTLQEAESVLDEILGEEKFVGEESLCPACGAVTNVYSTRCDKCGALFDVDSCRCGHCGAEIPKEALFCPSCNLALTESDALCPICSTSVPYRATACPACGAELAEGDVRCANCGNIVEPNAVSCTVCGTLLVEGVKSKSEAGPAVLAAGSAMPLKAVLETGGEVAEVEVENRIENKLTVEAVLKPAPEPEAPKKPKGGNLVDKARERRKESLFPFTAVIGQEKMKLALILNVIDPLIGGVLITGQKGTGKSVTVRGVAEITPEIRVIDGCRFSCEPDKQNYWCWECHEKYDETPPESLPVKSRPLRVVDLPLNATEDRVVGTLDVSKVLTEGIFSFESGVLAEANRGVLYVDEINLLDDYVVDVLLDAAAMGVVTVEREGVSVRYPARFVMVGSMNPEEGGLRPQLLDRIALQVSVTGIEQVEARMEVVQRRMDFESDPQTFRARFDNDQQAMRDRIKKAREMIPHVKFPTKIFAAIPKVTTSFGVDGHRADIMIERGSVALAAYEGKSVVDADDVLRIAEMVLPHRMRRKPFEQTEFSSERLKRLIAENI
jgi:magnesium chelatase subunit I